MGHFYLFIYFLLSIVASTLPEVNIASGLLCQTSNIVFCSLRMKNFRIIPFFLTLSHNQPDQPDHYCSAQNINILKLTHNTLLSQNISIYSVSPIFHTFLSFLFQIKLFSRFPSSSVSERNKARVLLPLTFFHNDDKACAPVLASGSPVVFCSRSHYELIIRIIG